MLEKVIDAMNQKVLSMEIEIEQSKKKNILPKVTEEPSRIKVHEYVSKSQVSVEKCTYADKNLLDSKKGKDKKEMAKESDSKEEFFNCFKCKYKCKKELFLQKHMKNKHEQHECEKCGKSFLHHLNCSFMLQNTTANSVKHVGNNFKHQ